MGQIASALECGVETIYCDFEDPRRNRRFVVQSIEAGGWGGRPFEDGLGLLLHQGALSFEFWTGQSAPIEAMREALQDAARNP